MRTDDAQLSKAFDQAPNIIQEALTDGVAITFMAKLPSRYGIHIDTAGYVTEFIRDMLLGFIRPEAFIGRLSSVGISDSLARQITSDLNREVFVPLRDEMRRNGNTVQIPQHSVPHVPVMSVAQTPSAPMEPVPEQPSYNLIHSAPSSNLASTAAFTPVPVPTVRTMQHDMDLVQHGNLPTAYPATQMPHPSQSTPARMFQTASIPITPAPIPVNKPEIIHVVPDQPVQSVIESQRISSNSSSDPYREPI